MKRTILLCAAVAVFAGCKGDVSPSSQPEAENESHSSPQNPSQPAASPSAGYESPQAAYNALQQAAENKDIPAFVRCLDAESQEMMATMMTLPLAFMAIDPEKEKDVNELLSKHGISLEEESEEFPIKTTEGRIAYLADVMEWLEENSDDDAGESGPINALVGSSLGEVTIDGDSAHATLTLADNQTDEMQFRRIDGQWFVHLPEPEFSAGPPTGAGVNETFGESDFGAFGRDDEPPPPIEAVPLEEFQSAWQVTLDEKDQPARGLLTKLAKQLGLELKVDAGLESALQKPVSLEAFEGSAWEAIEQIARQADVTPGYTTSSIEFEAGTRELPVAFAGPFVIDMTNFETDPKTATGEVSLQVIAAGLPPAVVTSLEEGIGSPVELTAVTDSSGNELRRDSGSGSGGMIGFGGMSPNASVFQREVMIGLKNLLRGVETVNALKGRISFSLPTKVEILKFDELKPGVEKKAGGITLTLEQINGSSVTFKYNGGDNDDIHLLAFDAQGKRVESFGSSSFGSGDSGQMSEDYESAPARIEARIVTQQEELEYEFQFEDIPVPNHGEMPEQLSELKFEGESPVSLKFDSFTGEENFRKIKLEVTNHSNKDAESISMKLSYLDENGKELKNFPTSHGFDVVPAGESTDIEVSAFFMPKGTKSVKTTLRSVEFTDATQWEPE